MTSAPEDVSAEEVVVGDAAGSQRIDMSDDIGGLLEQMCDQLGFGISLIDRNRRWIRVNKAMAEINGIPRDDHPGERTHDLLPEQGPEIDAAFDRVFDTGAPVLGEDIHFSGKGRAERHFRADFLPIWEGNSVVAAGVMVRDTTEEQRLRDDLAQSEARMRSLFDQVPALITLHEGPEHHYVYANEAARARIGDDQPIGKRPEDVLGEGAARPGRAALDRVLRTGLPLVIPEQTRSAEDGHPSAVYYLTMQPWHEADGTIGGVMTFAFDITDQVRARQEARRANTRLRNLQDSLELYIGLLDRDGRLVEANRTARDSLDLPAEDLVGRYFWDCPWWDWDEGVRDRLKQGFERARQGELVRFDTPIRVANGREIWIDMQLAPVFDDDGTVINVIPSAMDITERHQSESRRQLLADELRHRVKNILARVQSVANFTARTSADKQDLVDRLQTRLAAIGRSHDQLVETEWKGQWLRQLLGAEMAPYAGPGSDRLRLIGEEDAFLAPSEAMSMGLALHELLTNAAKYGALSVPGGHVEVEIAAWPDRTLRCLDWRERGGPEVAPPSRTGFGSMLLERVLATELGADVTLRFPPEGLHLTLERQTG